MSGLGQVEGMIRSRDVWKRCRGSGFWGSSFFHDAKAEGEVGRESALHVVKNNEEVGDLSSRAREYHDMKRGVETLGIDGNGG